MAEVTDPEILNQLNGVPSGMQPVTDPSIIAQLEGNNSKSDIWNKLGETWPAKMAKDIYSAVKLPGDVYSGQTQVDPSNPEFMNRVTGLAGISPTTIIPNVASSAPSVEQLVKTGGKQIGDAVNSGLMFPTEKVQAGIDTIRQSLPSRRVAEDTHATLDALQEKVDSGQPLTFADIKQTRDELLDTQANAAKSTGRTAATDLRSATIAKHGLDDIVAGTPEGDQFIEGNANVSGGKQAENLDKRLYRSELRSAAANSGKNVGNTIRQNVASMLLSKDARGMSPDTIQQAENIVYGSAPENFMRHWGNVLGGGGGLGQALTGGMAGGLGYLASGGSPTITGISAAALPIAGALMKHGANEAAVGHLEALSNALRNNTPLGQNITRSGNLSLGGEVPGSAATKAALIRALMARQIQQPTQP